LQKCTELGITDFLPVISERTIKKDFNLERAQKIVIEASEQCGRGDIPTLHSPKKLKNAVDEYKNKIDLYFADKGQNEIKKKPKKSVGILIGPEGGWSQAEIQIFKTAKIKGIDLGNLVLRAETAAIVSASKLL